MIEVIPAIIAKSYEELEEKIRLVKPYVKRAHLDIMDGVFVPNVTIGPAEIEVLETNLRMGVHLMVSKPENHIVRWLETRAEEFIFHIEATRKAEAIIAKIKESNKIAGLALNPQTNVDEISPFVDEIDFVHFMTVEPGFYGGEFVEAVLDKISDFHYFYPDKPIQVDGGVDLETAPKLVQAGATILVAGSYVFESKNIGEAISSLKAAKSEAPNPKS